MQPQYGSFCWNELSTANTKAAKEFYSKMFGWKFVDHETGDMTYTMIQIDGKDAGGMWAIPKDMQSQIPSHWMTYILVENVAESLNLAEKNGAKVIKPVTQAGEMGKFAIITDPTGAHIALWQPLRMKATAS